MSIDEAITHAREVANEQKRRSGICVQNDLECDKFSSCLKCAEEHELLAEWLEELKAYRQYIDLTEIPEQYKLGFQDGIIEGNNKAIDNFAILMKETLNHDWATTKISEQIIYNRLFDKCSKIAEQLKAGGK